MMLAAPQGFSPIQDLNDNYQFIYPFGWQEVAVKGTDVVYKDVIEPLESVSVTIAGTDKKDVTEFGPLAEVRSGTCTASVVTHQLLWQGGWCDGSMRCMHAHTHMHLAPANGRASAHDTIPLHGGAWRAPCATPARWRRMWPFSTQGGCRRPKQMLLGGVTEGQSSALACAAGVRGACQGGAVRARPGGQDHLDHRGAPTAAAPCTRAPAHPCMRT